MLILPTASYPKLSRTRLNKSPTLLEKSKRCVATKTTSRLGSLPNGYPKIDFATQQTDFSSQRQKGTGTWFLKSPEFVGWRSGTQGSVLFCPGIPGAGKTMLSSLVIDHLWTIYPDVGTGVAYMYCNYKKYEEQKAVDLLSALLKQLVQQQISIPESVQALYKQYRGRRTRPSFDEVLKTLQGVIKGYRQVFIVVDALDECQDGFDGRDALLFGVRSLRSFGAKIMVTSRAISKITQEFETDTALKIRAHEEDVRRYVCGQVGRLAKCVSSRPALEQLIISSITDAVDGMYVAL